MAGASSSSGSAAMEDTAPAATRTSWDLFPVDESGGIDPSTGLGQARLVHAVERFARELAPPTTGSSRLRVVQIDYDVATRTCTLYGVGDLLERWAPNTFRLHILPRLPLPPDTRVVFRRGESGVTSNVLKTNIVLRLRHELQLELARAYNVVPAAVYVSESYNHSALVITLTLVIYVASNPASPDHWDLTQPSARVILTRGAVVVRVLKASAIELLGWYLRQFEPMPLPHLDITLLAGPSDGERRIMWQRNDDVRRRLAQHLLAQPGVLIDWEREPLVPWRGMKFFHGTEVKHGVYQPHRFEPGMRVRVTEADRPGEGVVAEPGQRRVDDYVPLVSGISISPGVLELVSEPPPPEPCRLTWDAERKFTAFTTPYPTKALNYGVHIVTYRLLKGGRELRLLDLRNDYDAGTHGQETDPFRHIHELAGIPYGSRNRIEKASLLQRLFHDARDVDGAILNNDIEWIWFRPQEVLASEWAHPIVGLTATLRNERDLGRVYVAACLELASRRVDADGYASDLRVMLKRIHPTEPRRIKASELPHVRWRLDEKDVPYTNHFLAWREDLPPVWRTVQLQGADAERFPLLVYQVNYHALWREINPELDDIYMANSMTEGNHNEALPYHQLLQALEEINEGVYPELKPMTESSIARVRMQSRLGSLEIVLEHTLASPTEMDEMSIEARALRAQLATPTPADSPLKPRLQLLVFLPNGRTQLVPPLAAPRSAWDRDFNVKPWLLARQATPSLVSAAAAAASSKNKRKYEKPEAPSMTDADDREEEDESHKAPRMFARLLLG